MAVESRPLIVDLTVSVLSRICGWHRPANGFEREIEALDLDPSDWLQDESTTFPSLGWRIYLAWLPFVLIAIPVVYFGVIQTAKTDEPRYLGWAGIGLIVILYLVGPAIMMRYRIQLGASGFQVINGHKRTFVPWICLATGRDWTVGIYQIRIPLNGTANELIQTTVKSQQFSLSQRKSLIGMKMEGSDLVLTWCYQLNPDLFVSIARRMAAPVSRPTGSQPVATNTFVAAQREAAPVPTIHTSNGLPLGVIRLQSDTLQVPVSAVTFPCLCCRCEAPTTSIREIDVTVRHMWFLPARMESTLEMPVCDGCNHAMTWRYLSWLLGLESLWALMVWLPFLGPANASMTVSLVVIALGLVPVFWLLSFPSLAWRVASVVRNSTTNEMRFRFIKPSYVDSMIEAIHSRE